MGKKKSQSHQVLAPPVPATPATPVTDEVACARMAVGATSAVKDYTSGKRCARVLCASTKRCLCNAVSSACSCQLPPVL